MKKTKKTVTNWPTARTDEVMLVQETMRTLGLYSGSIDGIAGTQTLLAVRTYKKSVHLAPDNKLSKEFIEHLRNET